MSEDLPLNRHQRRERAHTAKRDSSKTAQRQNEQRQRKQRRR